MGVVRFRAGNHLFPPATQVQRHNRVPLRGIVTRRIFRPGEVAGTSYSDRSAGWLMCENFTRNCGTDCGIADER
jgi:hypothetical protein